MLLRHILFSMTHANAPIASIQWTKGLEKSKSVSEQSHPTIFSREETTRATHFHLYAAIHPHKKHTYGTYGRRTIQIVMVSVSCCCWMCFGCCCYSCWTTTTTKPQLIVQSVERANDRYTKHSNKWCWTGINRRVAAKPLSGPSSFNQSLSDLYP